MEDLIKVLDVAINDPAELLEERFPISDWIGYAGETMEFNFKIDSNYRLKMDPKFTDPGVDSIGYFLDGVGEVHVFRHPTKKILIDDSKEYTESDLLGIKGDYFDGSQAHVDQVFDTLCSEEMYQEYHEYAQSYEFTSRFLRLLQREDLESPRLYRSGSKYLVTFGLGRSPAGLEKGFNLKGSYSRGVEDLLDYLQDSGDDAGEIRDIVNLYPVWDALRRDKEVYFVVGKDELNAVLGTSESAQRKSPSSKIQTLRENLGM